MDRLEFIKAKRIVVKLGTSVLRNDEGYVSLPRSLFVLLKILQTSCKIGERSIVITSGAVGLGKKRLGLLRRYSWNSFENSAMCCYWVLRGN